MTIEVVTYDVGTGCLHVDHTWDGDGDVDQARQDAREWRDFLVAQDKSTDHVTFIREVE